ncbi:MAG: NAD-glutamate dehydrogenase [Rhodospirillales bacterium]
MASTSEQSLQRLIGRIASQASKGQSKARKSQTSLFAEQYYRHVSPHDVVEREDADLAAIAVGHRALGDQRRPGEVKLDIFNPSKKSHGWTAERTAIQIVNDDMPFLVDSVTAAIQSLELSVHVVFHPIIQMTRDSKGRCKQICEAGLGDPDVLRESFMHLEITHQPHEGHARIRKKLLQVLEDVRNAVNDWRPMRHRMWSLIEELESGGAAGSSAEQVAQTREFLSWIHDNHFTFLGFRDYKFTGSGKTLKASIEPRSGLGVLRDPKVRVFKAIGNDKSALPEVPVFVRHRELVMVTKTQTRATVHRRVHMDAIAIKRLDAKGNLIGQRLFVGLFTSSAYNRTPREIPMLREKLDRVVQRAGFRPASHDGKALMNILETYPRDELFQVSDDDLYRTAIGILHLQERQRVALFVRADDFERHMSCLVFIPRDRFNSDLRARIGEILAARFDGRVSAFRVQFGDGPLARVHYIIGTTPGSIPAHDLNDIEAELADAARSWSDKISEAFVNLYGERVGMAHHARFEKAFAAAYQYRYSAEDAVEDAAMVDYVLATGDIGMNLYDADGSAPHQVRFKLYHPDHPIPLSDALPMFEHMGFRVVEESPHEVSPACEPQRAVMIHDFGLATRDGRPVHVEQIRENFHEAFHRVWRGEIESDGFNALVCRVGLTWRQVAVLRGYCKYLRQAGIPFSQTYMEQTLSRNPELACEVVKLFEVQFNPKGPKNRNAAAGRIRQAFEAALESVASADEDRILRRFLNAVESTLRTNYYQVAADGEPKPYISFKFDSRALEELPLPRPLREIFVYSPRVEGVHLRFGLVARGGLRWSDRFEDFRTEVLGLVKAQQVKNAVIVPVGSKGGFVVKRPPVEGGREAYLAEGIACYKLFISGLLDITDNIKGSKVVPPKNVLRRDGDDPYLVVAADKGTATFSDIANGVSLEYGHWLGDAFASGGSQGYDHKGMGITARGAWECVKRHFREIGTDIQNEDFSVIGVGDMSGDVFGNGMLLSKHIRLIGAFNHMHIFIDPNPDAGRTWKERKRLFDMGRSSWTDYDKKLISKGGAIYERSAKSLKLTPEIKKLFGIDKDTVTPNELLKIMLRAGVDLLWFGGIGTYIKSSSESNADAGDRANDAIRINGSDVGAKVIGEGANLGATQLGRIEYGLQGGRSNTDAIDNSAGVDCSDHEVNIKILLDAEMQSGGLGEKQRNKLLADMTEEVAALVLVDNYQQSQAISMAQAMGCEALEGQKRLMRDLERRGRLDRIVEFLPNDEDIDERLNRGVGLTRPELAVLLSYAKLWLYDQILESDVPDDPAMTADLIRYFPTPLGEKYRSGILKHRLRREIVATRITNSLINRTGEQFVHRFMERTGIGPANITRAYIIAREVYGVRPIWAAIESLDNKVPASVQTAMLQDVYNLLERGTLWFLRNGDKGLVIDDHIRRYGPPLAELGDTVMKIIPERYRSDLDRRAAPYEDAGVPRATATRVAGLVNMVPGCDIVRIAEAAKSPVAAVAKAHFGVGSHFRLGRLRAAAEKLGADGHWRQLAVDALIEEIYGHQSALTARVMTMPGARSDSDKAFDQWLKANDEVVSRASAILDELWTTDMDDLSMIAVASRQLRSLYSA